MASHTFTFFLSFFIINDEDLPVQNTTALESYTSLNNQKVLDVFNDFVE